MDQPHSGAYEVAFIHKQSQLNGTLSFRLFAMETSEIKSELEGEIHKLVNAQFGIVKEKYWKGHYLGVIVKDSDQLTTKRS